MTVHNNRKYTGIWLSIGVGLFSFCAVAVTLDDIGWTCDEVYYFLSSDILMEWFGGLWASFFKGGTRHILSQSIIDGYWLWDPTHNPHPPLYKLLPGITWILFRDVLGELTAYRISSALLCGLMISVLFYTVNRRYGVWAGLYAGLSLLLMPRFFGHAHIAATEMPLMVLWFATTLAFWYGLYSLRGSLVLGLLWGFCLATKFTSLLVPVPLALWCLLFREKKAVRNFLTMLLVSPAVAFLCNPGWWHQPLQKIARYLETSTSRADHIPIPTLYFDTVYSFSPPWTYPPFMTALTIPVPVLVLFLVGVLCLVKNRAHRPFNVLMLLSVPVLLGICMLPATPTHDGMRQFIFILPGIAYCAGIGFRYCARAAGAACPAPALKKTLPPGLCLLLLLYSAGETVRIHPFELSYYNRLIGGLSGAYRRGMEVTYWFDAITGSARDTLNRLPPNTVLSIFPMASHYFEFLQRKDAVRSDLRFITPDIKVTGTASDIRLRFEPERPEYLLLLSRFGTFTAFYRNLFQNSKPVFSIQKDGVPLLMLYRWRDVIIIPGRRLVLQPEDGRT